MPKVRLWVFKMGEGGTHGAFKFFFLMEHPQKNEI